MVGKVYGVGVGPGDPKLMTLKAVETIQFCDVIGIPVETSENCTAYQIALQAVPQMSEKQVLCVPIPMTTDRNKLEQAYETGVQALVQVLKENKNIAFLNLGDPTLYGTYMELHQRIKEASYEAEIISGVTSFCAVAATLGIPLAAGKEMLHILPGFYYLDEIEKHEGTKILMKSASNIKQVKERLVELEGRGKIKAYAITNCGMKDEIICDSIENLEEQAGYFTTIMIKEK